MIQYWLDWPAAKMKPPLLYMLTALPRVVVVVVVMSVSVEAIARFAAAENGNSGFDIWATIGAGGGKRPGTRVPFRASLVAVRVGLLDDDVSASAQLSIQQA
jgi:hypothetical protein